MPILLRELTEDVEYIKEEKDGKTSLYLRGPFAQAEVTNRNKRFYPMKVLGPEIGRFTTEKVNNSQGYGELGHPSGPNINLDRVCVLIKELNEDGNNFMGKALVTSTPMGKIVTGLIGDGAKLGVSTRALGSLKLKDEINEVQDDLKLLAIDVVADPSAPDAFVAGIMEGSEYLWNPAKQQWVEHVVQPMHKEMQKMTVQQIEEQKIKLFKKWLSSLI